MKYILRTKPYSDIISLIRSGEENALHLSELISLTGIDDRILRKHIETIRRNGVVIASNKKRLLLPGNIERNRRIHISGKLSDILVGGDIANGNRYARSYEVTE